MYAVSQQLGNLPIQISYLSNGYVVFDRLADFQTIVDNLGDGVQAILSNQDIAIGANTVVEYGMQQDYKNEPELLAWLVAQNLTPPRFY